MDSSSDESFVWTKASTGSDDSDEMHLTINNENAEDYEVKMENHIMDETHDSSYESKKESKSKKRKHKKESLESEEIESPKKKRIKTEQVSDSDSVHKKKNNKHKNICNGSIDNSYDSLDDDYLNIRVKQEKYSHELLSNKKTKKGKNLHKKLDDNVIEHEISSDINENISPEKKSKKKKKHNHDSNNSEQSLFINGNHDEEDTVKIKKSPKKKKHKENRVNGQEEYDNTAVDEESIVEKIVHKTNKEVKAETINVKHVLEDNHTHSSSEDNSSDIDGNTMKKNYIQDSSINNKDKVLEVAKSQETAIISKRKLSERIKFEDEIESDTLSNANLVLQNNDESVSSHLKRFLKENSNLQPISKKFNRDSVLTDNDEIWILKCPHDVDINELKNSELTLDTKCKLKINGETYHGQLDDNTKINILSSNKQDFQIHNLVPNGSIYFRKRLPKPHYQEDNVTVNKQTDFIPLPETKCRHPLFGSNYKNIINVYSKRLNNSLCNTTFSSDKKKRKHKKSYTEVEIKPKIEYDSETSDKKAPKMKFDPEVPVKKAKKRKHKSIDEDGNYKSKRMKLEPDSAEAWASEKAIEENLFNF